MLRLLTFLLAILLPIAAPIARASDVNTPRLAVYDVVAVEDCSPITPRPVTLLLVGAGMVALGVARRMSVRKPPSLDRRR